MAKMREIALEAIFGAYTTKELANKHGVEPHQVLSWTWRIIDSAQEALYEDLPR